MDGPNSLQPGGGHDLPNPRDPTRLVPFLRGLLPRWIDLWIERDVGIPGRSRRVVKATGGAESFRGSTPKDRALAYQKLGRGAEQRVQKALEDLHRAGFTQSEVSVLYALADVFEPKAWRNRARKTLSRVHSEAARMGREAIELGAPPQVSAVLEAWRSRVSVEMGVAFFPENPVMTAPRDLRTAARRLLMRCGMHATNVALVEIAWLLPVSIPEFDTSDRPSRFPIRLAPDWMIKAAAKNEQSNRRNQIKTLGNGEPFAIWHHLRIDRAGRPTWEGEVRDRLSDACDHCIRADGKRKAPSDGREDTR
jgi:hypothetical protein